MCQVRSGQGPWGRGRADDRGEQGAGPAAHQRGNHAPRARGDAAFDGRGNAVTHIEQWLLVAPGAICRSSLRRSRPVEEGGIACRDVKALCRRRFAVVCEHLAAVKRWPATPSHWPSAPASRRAASLARASIVLVAPHAAERHRTRGAYDDRLIGRALIRAVSRAIPHPVRSDGGQARH